jgi:hypothetical protein
LSNPLGRRWRRRQHARFNLGLESILGMCAITKWFIIASAAATQGDIFPPWCTERGAASVAQLDIAFDAQWTIVSDRDFPWHTHLPSLGVYPSDRTTDIDREGRAPASSPEYSTISQIASHHAVKFASGRIVSTYDASSASLKAWRSAAISPSALRQMMFHIGFP